MIHIADLLKPTIDYVFKRIFGYVGNEKITTNLLNSILDEKIADVNLDCNTFLLKDFSDDKIGILDVKAKTDTGVDIDIEMQVAEQAHIIKRLLFYWSKMYSKNLKSGYDYSALNKCIVILIADFDLKELQDSEKFLTKWVIKDKEYGKQLLTDLLEIIIIELPKVEKYKQKSDFNTWAKFIEKPEVIDMAEEKNEAVKDAKKVLEEISSDEKERYLAELREKYILDTTSNLNYKYKEGLEQGKNIEKIEIAKNMLAEKLSADLISKLTGLSKEEIEELK